MKKTTLFFLTLTICILFLSACTPPEITSAKVYLQQDNAKAAEEQLEKAKDLYPDNPEIYWLLATAIYIPNEDYEKAKTALNRCKKSPAFKAKAENEITRIWGAIHTDAANYFNDALNSIMESDKDSLLKISGKEFDRALSIQAKRETFNGIVKCYYLLKDSLNVQKYAEMAIDNEIFDKEIMLYYIQTLWVPDRYEETLQKLDDIIADHPDESAGLKGLQVQFLTEIKEYDKAMEKIKILLEDDPFNTDLRFIMAQIYVQLGDLESAIFEFEKVIADHPDDPEVIIRIAQTTFNSKDWVMAEEYSNKYIEIEPDKAIGYEILWKALYNQGKKDEAEEYRAIAKSLR